MIFFFSQTEIPRGFIRLVLESPGNEVGRILFKSGNQEESRVEFIHSNGTGIYDFYYGVLGFTPREIELQGGNVKLVSLSFREPGAYPQPIDIDFSSLLTYPRELWRTGSFELYRWSLAPDILVFDFEDYTVQSAFLKRMAFFVEKEGVRGRLLSNEVIAPLHGWNAHDYRAEDIARFFSVAEAESFTLNPEEQMLSEILLNNGIIEAAESGYLAGKGGFLSITRESPAYLRRLFLTHEGCHGLFFTDSGLRNRSELLWQSFSLEEKEFWRTFFSWKGYDAGDQYLVVNELQAYLLQQSVKEADPYYLDYTLPRMTELFPASQPVVDRLIDDFPGHFTNAAGNLNEYLMNRWGVRAGNLSHLIFSN